MNRAERRENNRKVRKISLAYGDKLVELDLTGKPKPVDLIRAMRNRRYMVLERACAHGDPVLAILTISAVQPSEKIRRGDIMDLKAQMGYAKCDAVEVFPRAGDPHDWSEMHLFVLSGLLPFAWRKA